jgi:hypothetical protein
MCQLYGIKTRLKILPVLNLLKSLNLTNIYPNNNNNNNNNNNHKVKRKPLELYELAGKNLRIMEK